MSASLNRKYKDIGSRIASLRILAGISREDFCRKYKVNEYTLQAWELGRNKMRKQAAEKLCHALNVEKDIVCTVDWIYFGKGLAPYSKVKTQKIDDLDIASQQQKEELDQEMILQCEVDFFKRLQALNMPVVLPMEDDAMLPLYKMGDYVGGILVKGDDVHLFHGEVCIIETAPKVYTVRRFLKGDGCFILVPLNAAHKVMTVQSIKSIYEIIWHRCPPRSLNTPTTVK